MQGQIAGATPLSQLFIYIKNCLQFGGGNFPLGRADRSKSINMLEGGQELFRVEDRVRTEISLNKGGREDRSKLINR